MTGDIQIYGGIGRERNEVSFDNVKAQIDANKSATELAVHIVSPGGDVFEGEAIYNLLKNAGKPVTTYIEGTCASIATLIALAGDKIVMNETGRFMIHNPKISGLNTQADARDLQHIGMQLDKIKTLLIDVSAKKTGISKEELWTLYDNETWMTSAEAKQKGFVDELQDAIKAVAKVDLTHYQMKDSLLTRFDNRLKAIMSFLRFKNEFNETLADGRPITVMSEDEDWTGKQVIYTDTGENLEPGDYQLATGKIFSVGDGSVITTVTESVPSAEAPTESPEDMKKIEELTAQLAEVTAAKEAAEAALAGQAAQTKQATAQASRLENKFNELSKEFIALKEETSKTMGDTSAPGKGKMVIKNSTPVDDNYDPMFEEAKKYFKNRNIITDED